MANPVGKARRWATCGIAALSAAAVLPAGATHGQTEDQPATLPPLRVVVLVDESGSLDEADVAAEKEAARTIVFSVLAPGSVVSVAGFASSDGPGQSPVDVVCPPTVLDSAQKRDTLGNCVGDLRRRNPDEGDGTDHVAALSQALDTVKADEPAKKVVFLLTDGKLDVAKSPAWGDTPERRNSAAAGRVREVLADLDEAGAQVWPMGFGDVDTAALSGFAVGRSCTPAAPDPRAQVSPTPAELKVAVANAFSSASCVRYGPLVTDEVPQGGSVELPVVIPEIASDASIVVYKRDPRIQVEYRAPDADQPAPRQGGTDFEFAGQSTETESVRIVDPRPGEWTVRLSSADVPTQQVAATVVFQAAVKANLSVSPPRPAAGQTVDISMQVWARGRAVTDPETLAGLSFVTTLTGDGVDRPPRVALTDDAADGTFDGKLTVPKEASGALTFTGQVTGVGIGGDTRVLYTGVQPGSALLTGQILFDRNDAAVVPGGTVTGTVSVTNDSGTPEQLRLLVATPSAGASLTVDPGTVRAAAGVTKIPFTLRFGDSTVLGSNAATLRVVDAADPAVVVAEREISVVVREEPAPRWLFWALVALAALLLVAGAFLAGRLRARAAAARVRDLRVRVLSGGSSDELSPRDPNAKRLVFAVHQEFTGWKLREVLPGDPNAYTLRRRGNKVVLVPPGGQPVALEPEEPFAIGAERSLVVIDDRSVVIGAATGEPAALGVTEPAATDGDDPFADVPPLDPFAEAMSSASGTSYPASGAVPDANSPVEDPFVDDMFDHGPTTARSERARHDSTPGGGRYFDPDDPFS
ncbi:VWA domain-containing protein [Actinophytocola sp.]|uniref:VWA domain-containing protein n=1 Tax=Actinophytocola sp. TaxID=1872138 RepID=UPI002ED4ABD0